MSDKILMGHGSGGRLMHNLVRDRFLTRFKSKILHQLTDAAVLEKEAKGLVFTTDSYVVKPIFFPGGDIGKLAICGTVNDLSVMGAFPKYITCGFIVEEGLELSILEQIFDSMKKAETQSGVELVAGDLKVVGKGEVDKVFINTSGIGVLHKKANLSWSKIKPGDKIIINGDIGEHGIAIISKRQGLDFQSSVKSDCAPLNWLIKDLLDASSKVNFMRDATRGGLATVLNEISEKTTYSIEIDEASLPIGKGVRDACELLGFDPLYVANEGKLVVVVDQRDADKVLRKMKKNVLGKKSRIIGEVQKNKRAKVYLKTAIGGARVIDMLAADQLPRIC
jgi:hydrogenase expression/formation protein HypE